MNSEAEVDDDGGGGDDVVDVVVVATTAASSPIVQTIRSSSTIRRQDGTAVPAAADIAGVMALAGKGSARELVDFEFFLNFSIDCQKKSTLCVFADDEKKFHFHHFFSNASTIDIDSLFSSATALSFTLRSQEARKSSSSSLQQAQAARHRARRGLRDGDCIDFSF